MPFWHKAERLKSSLVVPFWHKVRAKTTCFVGCLMSLWHNPYAKLAQRKCFCRQSKRPISTVYDRIRPSTNAKSNKSQRSQKSQANPKKPRTVKQEAARPSKMKQKPAKATICHQMPTTDFPHCSGLYRSSTIPYQPAINHEPTIKSTHRQHTVFRIVAGFIGCHCSVPNTRINKPVTCRTAQ